MMLFVLSALSANLAPAQEMEPRSYSPAPVGTQFVVLAYGWGTSSIDVKMNYKDGSGGRKPAP